MSQPLEPTTTGDGAGNALSDFGPNEWLVDEIYQQYLQDRNSVDPAWWEFFADYQPQEPEDGPEDGRRRARGADGGDGSPDGESADDLGGRQVSQPGAGADEAEPDPDAGRTAGPQQIPAEVSPEAGPGFPARTPSRHSDAAGREGDTAAGAHERATADAAERAEGTGRNVSAHPGAGKADAGKAVAGQPRADGQAGAQEFGQAAQEAAGGVAAESARAGVSQEGGAQLDLSQREGSRDLQQAWQRDATEARGAPGGEGRRASSASNGSAQPGPASAPSRADGATTVGTTPASGRDTGDGQSGEDDADAPPEMVRLKGPAVRIVTNMEASLGVPTATSVRAVPAKLLIDNRVVINNHLKRGRGGKVSFTHIIGYAIVQALKSMPDMNYGYAEVDGKPAIAKHEQVNLGLAIDVQKGDGTRSLLVPSIKRTETMDFAQFWSAYEDIVRRARGNKLSPDDFAGTTITLTNPGTIGTNHSVPRLMSGQGTIVGVGAMDYPAEYQGAAPETLARLAISKIMTLTSTYDHRIIQGAQSGEFLRRIHQLLLGDDGFFDDVFHALRIPYEPIRWVPDISATHEDDVVKQARVQELIHAYRVRGHLMADTDPLEFRQRSHPDLDVVSHGLTLWDLDREFATGGFGGKPIATLREILGVLRESYCRRIGIEYMHIQDPEERRWIQERVEVGNDKPGREKQLHILHRLNAAEAFETFLQTKYVGQKRFSLEGGESVIPLLDQVMSSAAEAGLDEVCIGMPHRGRLNVLANLAGKSYDQIFREFEGNQDPRSVQGSGDVKYHLGTEGVFTSADGNKCKVYLAANPSHLEAVNPVLEGITRAKQDLIDRGEQGFSVLPVLLHGDAAFAGQGVVAETLNLSQLRGYRTGGTVHVIVNNQVGFTTAPAASRSSFYCTDVARMIQAPIFHVNGDDPEACVRVAQLAFDYRQTFKKDVVIDMVCYRRRGHNEGDDPSMTQPLMYALIENKRSVRKLYTESLIGRGDISVEEAEQALRDYQGQLERVFVETREAVAAGEAEGSGEGIEAPAEQKAMVSSPSTRTAVDLAVIKRIADAHVTIPDGFTVHPKLLPLLQKRASMASQGGVDWAMGEIFAVGSLLLEGRPVRLAGQDTRRGTFVQRHAVLTDRETGNEWTPISQLDEGQARFFIYDSLLSEFAAMGFEYGYSVARPDALVLWEAQFGDFTNGAQPIVDEFVSSSEQKWNQRSSVVLLLPHGYEGQGPDHSSGRVERFLQMCAEDNMTVAMPTTPASYFHLLRWQAYHEPRRPLIVFTPKSMLRLKAAASPVEDLTSGSFRPVIPETEPLLDAGAVQRVILCSGKVYWDLLAERAKRAEGDGAHVAIVRVEQIHPLPGAEISESVSAFPNAQIVWVQEEPANQGPWPFIAMNLPARLGGRQLMCVSRAPAASPAAGSHKKHDAEQRALVERAIEL